VSVSLPTSTASRSAPSNVDDLRSAQSAVPSVGHTAPLLSVACPASMPGRDAGPPLAFGRPHHLERTTHLRQRVAPGEGGCDEQVEDHAPLVGRWVSMGQRRDPPRGVDAGVVVAGEEDRAGRRTHQRPVAGGLPTARDVVGGCLVPRQTGPQHRTRLVADVLERRVRPRDEAVEDLRLFELAAAEERAGDHERHLRVVRPLPLLPRRAAAHLRRGTERALWKPPAERPRRLELERRAERIAHRRSDQRTDRTVQPLPDRHVHHHPTRLDSSSLAGTADRALARRTHRRLHRWSRQTTDRRGGPNVLARANDSATAAAAAVAELAGQLQPLVDPHDSQT
jgi:hypothetical protein